MRSQENCFHLAIPCADLSAAKEFYSKLGCPIAREYNDRITVNFFGDQVVCHLSPENVPRSKPEMYPRHFGITFRHKNEFDTAYNAAKDTKLAFYHDMMTRFQGKREEHLAFFLIDPSNNLLEFKYYHDPEMMY